MKRSFLIISILFLILTTVGTRPVQSAAIDDLKASIDQKNAELEKIEKEIAAYQKQIDETGKEASSLKTTISQLNAVKNKLLADIKATQKKIDITNTNIKKLSVDITDKSKSLEKSLASLGSSIKNVDALESMNVFELVLSKDNFSDVWGDLDNLSRIQKDLNEHIESVRNIKTDLEKNKQQKEAEKNKLLQLKNGLSDQQKVVQSNQKEKDQLLKETKNKEANYQILLADRIEKKNQLEKEILDFESKIKLEIDPSKIPHTGSGVLSWPLDKITVTQYFGNTSFAAKNPQVYNGMGHNGVDFKASVGTPVKSAGDGVVIGTGNTDTSCYGASYGKWVLIRHNNGLSTLYAHLSLIKVYDGQQVSTGDLVGYSGNTGFSTGPHLHFTVYATQAVHVSGPTEYKSKTCGTYLKLPVSSTNGYLNPLSYL